MFRATSLSYLLTRSGRSIASSRYLGTLVIAEHEGGSLTASSLSSIEAARKFLTKDSSLSLLLAGAGPTLQEAAANAASCHTSVSEVLVADSDELKNPLAEPWAKLVHLVQQKVEYSHIIAASNSFGKNILPRAAALLDVSPITDVIDISESKQFMRPIYAGNALCTIRYTGADPCMLTIRTTSFPVGSTSPDFKRDPAPIHQVDLSTFGEDWKSRHVKQTTQDSERPDLGSARVVITGGRALKSAENFKLIEKLAEKLGAAVGATRAAVDAGYVPNDLQVGQTGKIVAPELYMAFGVSGAIQHIAGMRDSKVIVAVNKDADAPIYQNSCSDMIRAINVCCRCRLVRVLLLSPSPWHLVPVSSPAANWRISGLHRANFTRLGFWQTFSYQKISILTRIVQIAAGFAADYGRFCCYLGQDDRDRNVLRLWISFDLFVKGTWMWCKRWIKPRENGTIGCAAIAFARFDRFFSSTRRVLPCQASDLGTGKGRSHEGGDNNDEPGRLVHQRARKSKLAA
ncbi:hypothetical protein E3N88_15368 [Mikania micrantha]|uniref:Electron transfer flavoprotein subunit alpha, mitochondrial n=1 Tax=Mikania micrantha TaxID=192012 RepID=A0A5N6NWN7_9ASTR|nr:hypothetical protein E3N88_15368 [Mikania micrantha]